MDIDRLQRHLSAEPDPALALDLFDRALRAGESAAVAAAVDVLVTAHGVSRQQLLRCAERLAVRHRAAGASAGDSPLGSTAVGGPMEPLDDAESRATRELLHALVRRGIECALTVRTMTVDLDFVARLVDMPAVRFERPVQLAVAWYPPARKALLLDAGIRAVAQLRSLAPYDDAPAHILDAVRAHWSPEIAECTRADRAASEGRTDSVAGASDGPPPTPALGLDEAWALADELSTGHAGVDDMGWGLRYLIEGQGSQALESFRNVRGGAARADIWRCFDRDGSTIVRSPSDPSLEAAFDAVDRDVPRWEERDEERDGMTQTRFDFLFGHEPHAGGAVDEVQLGGFGTDGLESRRERACARAEALAHEQELEWQVERALRALLARR